MKNLTILIIIVLSTLTLYQVNQLKNKDVEIDSLKTENKSLIQTIDSIVDINEDRKEMYLNIQPKENDEFLWTDQEADRIAFNKMEMVLLRFKK